MPRHKKDPNTAVTVAADLEIIPVPAINKTAIAKARAQAITVTQEIISVAASLVVDTADQYHAADEILHKIKVAQKHLNVPFDEILTQVRPGMDALYAIRRAVENPLLDLEVVVKEKMRVWQIRDRKRIEDENRERERITRENAAKEAAAAVVAQPMTPPYPRTMAPMPIAESVTLFPTPAPLPIQAASSSARVIKRWKVTDLELVVKAVGLGMIPVDVLTVDFIRVNQMFKDRPEDLAMWPGFELHDDIQIAGR